MATKKAPPTTFKRKNPSTEQRLAVLTEAGFKCGNPNCRNILVLELHHIHWVADGGPTEVWNLLALCPMCHGLHTMGKIPGSAIKHWKGLLVALNGAFSRESQELLLYLAKTKSKYLWYSADGALHFAGLIAANLARILYDETTEAADYQVLRDKSGNVEEINVSYEEPPRTAIMIGLTKKGRLLVDSWKRGDQAEYVAALGVKRR